jgi:hypothetical protein
VRETCCKAVTLGLPLARITSGARATNSVAYLRSRSPLFSPHRMSICTFRPTAQPDCCST